jgi:hypothetical protein
MVKVNRVLANSQVRVRNPVKGKAKAKGKGKAKGKAKVKAKAKAKAKARDLVRDKARGDLRTGDRVETRDTDMAAEVRDTTGGLVMGAAPVVMVHLHRLQVTAQAMVRVPTCPCPMVDGASLRVIDTPGPRARSHHHRWLRLRAQIPQRSNLRYTPPISNRPGDASQAPMPFAFRPVHQRQERLDAQTTPPRSGLDSWKNNS